MKRLAVVLALVAMSACQKAEQQQTTQTPADTSKRMIAPNKPAPKKKKP